MAKRGFYLRPSDWPFFMLGALMALVGIFVLGGSLLSHGKDAEGSIFPIAFIVFWLAVVGSQFLLPIVLAAMARARTCYALTSDGYAFVITDFFGFKVRRVYLPAVSNIELKLGSGGVGTIVFGTAAVSRFYGPWSPQPPSFERIDDAARVYEMCGQLQRVAAVTAAT